MALNLKNPFYKILSGNKIPITVKIISNSLQETKTFLVTLNLSDSLLVIRQELEKKKIIDDTLLFSKKHSNDNNINYGFLEIALEKEENYLLNEIIDGNGNILYLKQCSKPDWKCLNELRKLDYGCTMTFDGIKKAENRAFVMKNCELIEIGAEGYDKGIVEFKSNKDRMMKANLFFNTDINVQNFVELGISIGRMEINEMNSEVNSTYQFTKYGKAYLKFSEYLEPTQEFIEAVKDAIDSKNPENFEQITDKFGQFIPTGVILGGRAEYSEGKSSKFNRTKLIGGKQPDSLENFNEEAWIKSLKEDYRNWDSIEFQDPVSIFQLLSDDLRNWETKIFRLNIPSDVLKIVQNKDADCNIFATVIDMTESKNDFFTCQVLYPPNGRPSLIIHCVQKNFKRRECKLKIRWMVIGYCIDLNFILSDFNTQLKVLKNDFNMLNNYNSTMINRELLNFEYDSFIIIPPCIGIPVLTKLDSSNDSLIIGHHFFNAQEENKIGVCTFSYCLKNNHYVNLPNFTFDTLIISNYHNSNAYGTIPFEYSLMKKPYIDLDNEITANPKFISLYSTQKNNCGPIFLKQTNRQIKPKSIICKDKNCFICKNNTLNTSNNNIKCTFFDPCQGFVRFMKREKGYYKIRTANLL
ncbi:hypothetical protein C1645_836840 [Glomus cerebriforme]|uniref:DUF7431 domain-containing protein n=1 Tax=Glomus cerebriforme TaxID=658196 RepID=A0A397S568_9GLOM|nr:hypothetical protein C1645_836840 [Glomus cerebriforme]